MCAYMLYTVDIKAAINSAVNKWCDHAANETLKNKTIRLFYSSHLSPTYKTER